MENGSSNNSTEYDIAVIGGGPGGYVAALYAGIHGARVVLIEKDRRLGGTCLLRGCIPSKTMVKTAEILEEMHRAEEFGVTGHAEPNWAGIVARKDRVVGGLTKGLDDLVKARKITRLHGAGRLLGPGRILVQGLDDFNQGRAITVKAKSTVIATGSATIEANEVPGGTSPRIITSDGILDADLTMGALPQLPRSMVVIGGGIVGMEFASIFTQYGVKVTVVVTSPRILRNVDEEIARRFAMLLRQQGCEVLTKTTVQEFRDRGETLDVVVQTEGKEPQVLTCDYALYAKGRRPYTDGLGLEDLGVNMQRGAVLVDEYLRTNIPGIYAIGDVVPGAMLAHKASYDGECAIDNILGHERVTDYRAIPDVVFTLPEIASVGITEAYAKENNIPVKVTKFPFAALGRAQAIGEPHGLVNLVCSSEDGIVLGMQVMGAHAGDVIAEGTLAVQQRVRTEELAHTMHAHPTMPEAVQETAIAQLYGTPIHAEMRSRASLA
jgi:dihydrolipoamide dehydrogenase